MSVPKRVLLIVTVSAMLLGMGIGSGVGHPVRALPEPNVQLAGTTIPYAGHLSDEAGKAVADGAYDLSFTLYDTVSGGNPLWSELQKRVWVSQGEFLTSLGNVKPIPATALSGQNRWLAVAVRGPGEATFTALAPRQRVSAVAGATAAPLAGAACPHDHLGELWIGDSGAPIDGLYVENLKTGGTGLCGKSGTGDGVVGESGNSDKSGVYGNNTGNGHGVTGRGQWGVVGYGSLTGVLGESSAAGGYGVAGIANAAGAPIGVYGESTYGWAGYFWGNVYIGGTLHKSAGAFRIDHPLDPANKVLNHSFVESPDMKNIYDGVVTLDANGEAVVKLPDWFGALNRDFRYQLTCIGGYAPVYVAEEIDGNQFKIAGGKPGLKVSWQVTGIRQDPYAEQHRIPVEEDKPLEERGTYLYPEGYGLPAAMRPNVLHQPLEEAQP